MIGGVVLPDVVAAERWLRAVDDPVVQLLVATYLDGSDTSTSGLVEDAAKSATISTALGVQRADGSWGADLRPGRRILPTLWMTKSLSELGLGPTPSWTAAAEFLAAHAHDSTGVFAIDGHHDGVLSCYVGIAASTYLLGNRPDLAEPQIRWIVDHQQIRRRGVDLRPTPSTHWSATHWSDRLAVRFGGCMSATTCLVGMAKTGQALRCWSTTHPDPRVDALLGVIREQFLERELFRASNGSVLPLGVATPNAERWLDFTYPLDWRPDLIEVIDLVASGSFDRQLQPALDRLVTSQLPDGGWPLQRVIGPDALPSLERRNQRRASPYVTLRVVCALDKLGVSVRGGRQPKPSRSA